MATFGNKTIFVYASDCAVCVHLPSDVLSAAQVKELKCDVWLTVTSVTFSIRINIFRKSLLTVKSQFVMIKVSLAIRSNNIKIHNQYIR